MSLFNAGGSTGLELKKARAQVNELKSENARLKRENAQLRQRPDVSPDVAQFAMQLEARTRFTSVFPDAETALKVFSEAVEAHKDHPGIDPGESVDSWRAGQLRGGLNASIAS